MATVYQEADSLYCHNARRLVLVEDDKGNLYYRFTVWSGIVSSPVFNKSNVVSIGTPETLLEHHYFTDLIHVNATKPVEVTSDQTTLDLQQALNERLVMRQQNIGNNKLN